MPDAVCMNNVSVRPLVWEVCQSADYLSKNKIQNTENKKYSKMATTNKRGGVKLDKMEKKAKQNKF